MITIHNLDSTELLKLDRDDENFIHVRNITKEQIVDTEHLLLYSHKTLMLCDDKFSIINFQKCGLIDALNLKYKEFFPDVNIVVLMSEHEDDAFSHRRLTTHTVDTKDESKLKITFSNNTIYLNVIQKDLTYIDENLNLKKFLSDTDTLKKSALEVALLNDIYNIKSAQYIDYKKQVEFIKINLPNNK